MTTFVYMIRHGDSPKEENERTRGLTEKGQIDAQQVTAILEAEDIDIVVSSPYARSIATVEPLAHRLGKEILVFEDLKERVFSTAARRMTDNELDLLLEKSFSEPQYAVDGGESNAECQKRAIETLKQLIITFSGKKVALGTHGVVMTLMMRFYDNKYDLKFLTSISKPDIYKMEFNGEELVNVQRLWSEQ